MQAVSTPPFVVLHSVQAVYGSLTALRVLVMQEH